MYNTMKTKYAYKISLVLFVILIGFIILNFILYFTNNIFKKRYMNNLNHYKITSIPQDQMMKVNIGKNVARQSKIVICCLARNVEKELIKNISKLERTGTMFQEYKIILFENDSNDDTRNILKQWVHKNSNVILLDCPETSNCKLKEKKMYDIGALSDERLDKMSIFRNKYLNHVKQNFSHFDYMLVMDIDIQGPYDDNGILHSLSYPKFDMICTNGLMPGLAGLFHFAYDSLAFKDIKDTSRTKNNTRNYIFYNLLKMNQQILTSRGKLIPVKSAFNGMALYNMNSIKESNYHGNLGCEHVGFHDSMIQNNHGNIYINSLWKTYVGYQGPEEIF